MSFSNQNLSVVRRRRSRRFVGVCVVENISHFHPLLHNHWANFNQIWLKASLGEGDSSLFKLKFHYHKVDNGFFSSINQHYDNFMCLFN